jgi:hypothetical protein
MSMIVRGNEITIKRGSRSVFVGKRDGDAKGVYLKFTNKGADTFLCLSQEAAVALRVLLDNNGILGAPVVYETPEFKGETPCKPKKPRAKRRPAKS